MKQKSTNPQAVPEEHQMFFILKQLLERQDKLEEQKQTEMNNKEERR